MNLPEQQWDMFGKNNKFRQRMNKNPERIYKSRCHKPKNIRGTAKKKTIIQALHQGDARQTST